jgi:hypothetical protein
MINAQGRSAIMIQCVQLDETPMDLLMQRIDLQQALGLLDCRWIITFVRRKTQPPLQRLDQALLEALTLRQDPVIVAAGQQVAAVQLDCLLQISGRVRPASRLLELDNIEGEGASGSPLKCLRIDVQELIDLRPGMLQLMQLSTQVGPRTLLGQIGPQAEREVTAQLRRIPLENQIGQERLKARGADSCQRLIAIDKAEFTQQLNV